MPTSVILLIVTQIGLLLVVDASLGWFPCPFDADSLCQDVPGSSCAFHAGDLASLVFLKNFGSLNELGFLKKFIFYVCAAL